MSNIATNPVFEGFSLQDDNYITEKIVYRTTPRRLLRTQKISRRPGKKLLSHDFGERVVSLSGHIIGSSISDLQTKIDNLHRSVTRKEEGLLSIESDRTGTATIVGVSVSDPHYAQDIVPFEIDFLMANPFWYGLQQSVGFTVVSGTTSMSETVTISGTAFAEPLITYTTPVDTGQTTTSGVIIKYDPSGENITWSGTGATTTLAYGTSLQFDYVNQIILEGSSEEDPSGIFSRWNPGSTAFTVTFSGTAVGGTLDFSYQPRYF